MFSSVTTFKIDQNENQKHSIDKVLRGPSPRFWLEAYFVYKTSKAMFYQNKFYRGLLYGDWSEKYFVYKYPKKCFTKINFIEVCVESGQRNILYTRYPKKCFTKINFVEVCMESPCWFPSGWAPTWQTETNRNNHLL